MENWKKILKLIKKWTEDIDDRSQDLFIEELNNQYILIKRRDVHEVIFEPKAIPPEGIVIYGDADHKAMDQINKEIDDRTDDLAEEDVEWKDAQTKDIPWNRLMANKDTFTEKQANLIINNPDLFL